jgi:Flp pilus assembly protein TadD
MNNGSQNPDGMGTYALQTNMIRLLAADNPGIPAPFYAMAHVAIENSDFGNAIKYLNEACVLDPGNPLAPLRIGECLQKMGDNDGAEANYRRALEIDGDFQNGHVTLGKFLQDVKGDTAGAKAHYVAAIGGNSGDFPVEELRQDIDLYF